MSDFVTVCVTDRGAIYIDNYRITNRGTKWGVHSAIDTFSCSKDSVVKTCLERGYTSHVRSIDDKFFANQRDLPATVATRIAELEAQILTLKADLAGDAAMIEKMREEWIKTEATLGACVAEFAVERQRLTRIRSILEDLIAGNHSASVEQQARQALAITYYEGERT